MEAHLYEGLLIIIKENSRNARANFTEAIEKCDRVPVIIPNEERVFYFKGLNIKKRI